MGADLIGHMYRGPRDLDPDNVTAAKKEAAEVISAMQECRTLLDQLAEQSAGTPPVQDILDEAAIRENIARLLSGPLNRYTTQSVPEAAESILDRWCDLVDLDPEEVVNDFVEFWGRPSRHARDACERVYQEDDGTLTQVVFAGELSWGDEPQGYGYQVLEYISRLGIVGTLGLE